MHELNMLMFLVVGVASSIYTIQHIREERRSFYNAIALALACVSFARAGMEFWMSRRPGLSDVGKDTWVLTEAGEAQGLVFQIFLLAIFCCGLAMLVNGIHLMRREGHSIAHALPIFFGFMCIYYAISPLLQGVLIVKYAGRHSGIFNAVAEFSKKCSLFVLFMMFAYVIYSAVYMILRPKKEPDFIIIHGAKVFGNKVSPLLAKRIEKALELFWKYDGRPALIVSGGKGSDESCSEAEAMELYLRDRGIAENKIIKEDRSLTTRQNLAFSKEIMDGRKPGSYCVFTTNEYHVLRASILAAREKINGDGYGCHTGLYYLPAAAIRETAAFIVMYKKLAVAMILLFL